MAIIKRIVCLANSRKLSGRCLAGIELTDGKPSGWIRPVSDREHEEVSEYERQYAEGSDPNVLDIMDVPLIAPRPKGYQQENWLLNPKQYWTKVGAVKIGALKVFIDTTPPLWMDGYSTYNGSSDKIPLSMAESLKTSLRLIYVDSLALSVCSPGESFGNPKRRVQAQFHFGNRYYAIWLTDPLYEKQYLSKPNGVYKIGNCYLTISLGEPHKEDCYKLVAAIIEMQGKALK